MEETENHQDVSSYVFFLRRLAGMALAGATFHASALTEEEVEKHQRQIRVPNCSNTVSEVSQLNVQVLITAICYKQDDFPESIDSLLVCVVQIKFGLSAQLGDRFA